MGVLISGVFTFLTISIIFSLENVSSIRISVNISRTFALNSRPRITCEYPLEPNEYPAYLKLSRDLHTFYYQTFTREPPPLTKIDKKVFYPACGITILPTSGIIVSGNRTILILRDIDFATGGNFICEVGPSDGGPPASIGGDVSIISLPPTKPTANITGYPSTFTYGDTVEGNCTFSESYPEAEITFYLNGEKLGDSYNADIELTTPSRIRTGNRYKAVKGLFLRLTQNLIPPTTPRISVIKCEATLFDRKWETEFRFARV